MRRSVSHPHGSIRIDAFVTPMPSINGIVHYSARCKWIKWWHSGRYFQWRFSERIMVGKNNRKTGKCTFCLCELIAKFRVASWLNSPPPPGCKKEDVSNYERLVVKCDEITEELQHRDERNMNLNFSSKVRSSLWKACSGLLEININHVRVCCVNSFNRAKHC